MWRPGGLSMIIGSSDWLPWIWPLGRVWNLHVRGLCQPRGALQVTAWGLLTFIAYDDGVEPFAAYNPIMQYPQWVFREVS
jgi:hypothetical protein